MMKHQETAFRVLAEGSEGYIGVCSCCREFNFAYKTVLVSFQEEEMHSFFDWLITNCKTREHYMPLRHGRNRVFSSPHSNLFLVFNDQELEEIKSLYHQAVLLIQAENLLLANRHN
jgi:hypothetical protein